MPNYANDDYSKLSNKVGAYLSDFKNLNGALTILEDAMLKEVARRLNSIVEIDITEQTKQLKLKTGRPSHLKNLLATVLARTEEQNGFSLGMGKSLPTWPGNRQLASVVTGFLDPNTFRVLLMNKIPLKDPYVNAKHGEFTHRIQWYCLMNNQVSINLPHGSWADYYAWIGNVVHSGWVMQRELNDTNNYPISDKTEWKELGLWDALFDRINPTQPGAVPPSPYSPVNEEDCRCPENLHKKVTSQMGHSHLLLGVFLTGRAHKRESGPDINDYIAKKMFQKKFEALTEEQKTKVQESIEAGIF